MNRQRYRLIFNHARGMLMAVAESAAGHCSGDEKTERRTVPAGLQLPLAKLRRLAGAVALAMGAGLIALPLAQAQIVADPRAPQSQQPTILSAPNGVPLVNIQTPSAAGVSRNTYSQFDVQPNGAILNNSRNNVSTQLGGWVQGNPWLAAGTARIILNEVNSTNPSLLKGYVEVAGDRAQVVIANPAGVTCDGCGFINANRATLTTGTPIVNNGSLDGYRVTGGQIVIQGNGLDASGTDYTDLIARSVVINAGLWANQLRITTGANQVNADASPAAAIAGSGSAPAFALDVAQLGGMYAGKITLIGTEAGVGVRNAGKIGATAGDVALTADGLLTNSGQITSSGATRIDLGGGIANTGSIYAQGDAALSTAGNITNTGSIAAQGNTTLTATGGASRIDSQAGSVLAAGLNPDGTLAASCNLMLTATQAITVAGQSVSGGDQSLSAGQLGLAGSQIGARNLTLAATAGNIDLTGATLAASGILQATASQSFTNDGAQTSASQLLLSAHDLSNIGGTLEQTGNAGFTLQLPGNIDNTQGRIASNGGDLTLSAQTLTNTDGRIEHAGTGMLGIRTTTLDSTRGLIQSNGTASLTATTATLDAGQLNAVQVTIDTATLSNRGGTILQTGTGATSVRATTSLDNTGGTLASGGNTHVSVGDLVNGNGLIQAAASATLTVNATGAVDNRAGKLQSGGDLSLAATSLANAGGQITAGGTSSLATTQTLDNTGGLIAAQGSLGVSAGPIGNGGGHIGSAAGDLTLTATGRFDNTAGRLDAGGNLAATAVGLANAGGVIAGQAVRLDSTGQTLDNTQGIVAARGSLDIRSGALTNDAGLIQSGSDLSLDTGGQSLSNTRSGSTGGLISQGRLTLASGRLDNTAGFIGAQGDLQITGTALTNGGQIAGLANGQITGTGFANAGGQVQVTGNLTFSLGSGSLNNDASLLRAGQTLTVTAGSISNRNTPGIDQGMEGQSISLTANTLDNTGGMLRSGGSLSLVLAQSLNNTGGQVSAITLQVVDPLAANPGAKTLAVTNTGGALIAGQSLTVDAATLGGAGQILSQRDLDVRVNGDFANSGQVVANGSASITTQGRLSNSGTLQAGDTLTLSTAQLDNAASGQITAPTLQATVSGTLTNRGLIDGSDTRIDAGTVNNLGTGRLYGDHLSLLADGLTNDAENGTAATLAARNRLDIGARSILNRGNSMIYSVGDLAVGGALDGNRQASGQAADLTNSSATIQADGNLTLSVAQLTNQRTQFSVSQQASGDQAVYAMLMYNAGGPGALFKAALGQNSDTVVVSDSGAGRILAGRDLTLGGAITNDKSDILAGGNIVLNQAAYTGIGQMAQTLQSQTGITIFCRSCADGKTFGENHPALQQYDMNSIQTVITLDVLRKWAVSGFDSADVQALDWRLLTSVDGADVFRSYTSGAVAVASYDLAPARLVANQAVTGTAAQLQNLSVGSVATGPSATSAVRASAASIPVAGGTTVPSLTVPSPNLPGMVIRAVSPNLALPNNSLFHLNPGPASHVLIETDPRFADYRTWLSSDYLLQALSLDPATTQKRLGDGFYEQKLVREQVASLTGRRFLEGYASDEAEYRALLDNGVTTAKALALVPGVALTAAQVAQLTSDIVWLVEKEVALPDGTRQKVLVPQVYVVVKAGDLQPTGALIAGQSVNLDVTGDVTNSGTVAGRDLVALTAENLRNLGGRITGQSVNLGARTDLANLGGELSAVNQLTVQAGRDLQVASTLTDASEKSGSLYRNTITDIDRVAGLYVTGSGGTLVTAAGRDLTLTGAQVASAGSVQLEAGRDLAVDSLAGQRARSFDFDRNSYRHDNATTQTGSTVSAQGNLGLTAGQNLTVTGSTVQSGGDLSAAAGNNLSLATARVQESSTYRALYKGKDDREDSASDRSQISRLEAGGNLNLSAGGTLAAEGTRIQATGNIGLLAQTITLMAAHDITQSSGQSLNTSKGSRQQSQFQQYSDTAQGSVVSAGGNLSLASSGNTVVEGGALAAGQSARLATGGDLSLLAAQSVKSEERFEYKQNRKQASTLNFSESDIRQLLTTITVGQGASLEVGGNFTATTGERRSDGILNADRMTVDGVVKGDARQQVSVSRTGHGADGSSSTSQVVGDLASQGIRNHSNESFAPTAANAAQSGPAAIQQYLASGLLQVRGDPAVTQQLNRIIQNSAGTTLTYKDDSGKVSLTVAGQAQVQAVYNTLKLTETFDVKKFPNQQTAQVVTLVAAVVLTVCTGGAGAALIGAAEGTITATMANAAFVAMNSTMIGQLSAGSSFDKAFEAGVKAGSSAALTAGILNAPIIDTGTGVQSINQMAGITDVAGTGGRVARFSLDNLGQNLEGIGLRGVVNAGVNQAVYGKQAGSFGKNFTNSLVSDLAAVSANVVGQNTDTLSPGNIFGHATVGAVAAKLTGKDAEAGALGGASGAIVNPLLDQAIGGADGSGWGSDLEAAQRRQTGALQLGSMAVAGLAASAAGKDPVTAMQAAQNETLNNYLTKNNILQKYQRLAQATTAEERAAIIKEYIQVSGDNRAKAFAGSSSVMTATDLETARNDLTSLVTGPTACNANPVCRVEVRNSIGEIDGILRSSRAGENLEPLILAGQAVLPLVGGAELIAAKYGLRGLTAAVEGANVAGDAANAAARSEAAANVWQARQILADTRPDLTITERNQIIKAFDLESFRVNTLSSPVTEFRYFDGLPDGAGMNGRWSTPQWLNTPAERISNLALPNNQATQAATVTIQPGTIVFQGRVAPQLKFGPDLTGGGLQTYNALGPRAVIKVLP